MMSYESRPMAGPLGSMSGAVKGQIHEYSKSGNYYVTPEINRELYHIKHGVEHVNLDQDFLASSKDWAKRWNPQQRRNELDGAADVMNHASQTLNGIQGHMQARDIKGLQDNQVRQRHHTTMKALNQTENYLEPFANQSIDRIKQFCDHVGVTDRYTGYKNNLNRGTRDPVQLGYKWLADDRRNAGFCSARSVRPNNTLLKPTDPRNINSARGPSNTMSPPPCIDNFMRKTVAQKPTSIQEQCGINTKFPGKSEYMSRYKKPDSNRPTVPFSINPIPDTSGHGRPQAKVVWEPSCTEYQWRYEWPDSAKIEKLPWVKKF